MKKQRTTEYKKGYSQGYNAGTYHFKNFAKVVKCKICKTEFTISLIKKQFICANH